MLEYFQSYFFVKTLKSQGITIATTLKARKTPFWYYWWHSCKSLLSSATNWKFLEHGQKNACIWGMRWRRRYKVSVLSMFSMINQSESVIILKGTAQRKAEAL